MKDLCNFSLTYSGLNWTEVTYQRLSTSHSALCQRSWSLFNSGRGQARGDKLTWESSATSTTEHLITFGYTYTGFFSWWIHLKSKWTTWTVLICKLYVSCCTIPKFIHLGAAHALGAFHELINGLIHWAISLNNKNERLDIICGSKYKFQKKGGQFSLRKPKIIQGLLRV